MSNVISPNERIVVATDNGVMSGKFRFVLAADGSVTVYPLISSTSYNMSGSTRISSPRQLQNIISSWVHDDPRDDDGRSIPLTRDYVPHT